MVVGYFPNNGSLKMQGRFSSFAFGVVKLKTYTRENERTWAQKVPIRSSVLLKSLSSSGNVMKLSEMDPMVCHITESPYRILKMAAQGNLEEVEKLYFSNRERLTIRDTKGWSVIHHATVADRGKIIEFLAKHGGDLNQLTNEGESALHLAVKQGSLNSLRKLINCGADPNMQDRNSRSPLHLAVTLNKLDVIEALVEYKDKLDLKLGDENGRTALHIAAQLDFERAAKLIISKYSFCPNQSCNNGFYPIHIAAKNASVKVLEVLLTWGEIKGCERRKMICVPDLEGNVPLHLAVHGGEIKAVEICLRNGANISWQQYDNSTPVHLACSQGAVDIVKLMFELQPEEKMKVLETPDAQGMTPLHCAAMFDHAELVQYLLEQGASVDIVDNEHRSPLLLAASQRCWRSVEVLLNLGANPRIRDATNKNLLHVIIINGGSITDILCFKQTSTVAQLADLLNEQDLCGCSPMHYASKSGQIGSLASLIQLGASVRIKNHQNESPLHFAARYGRYNTVKQLLDSAMGFLIMNESDENGKTALHISSEEGHLKVLQFLLSKGALLHRDHQGRTPLHLAAEGGHVDAINALLGVWGHLLDQKDKDGDTPLHWAVKNNKPEAVSHLLSLNCKFLDNNHGFKPIDYAIQYKYPEAATAIVIHERGVWHATSDIEKYSQHLGHSLYKERGKVEVMQSPSEIHGCVCIALIRTLPKVFEAALNEAIIRADVKEDSKDFNVKYSFYPLQLSEEQICFLAAKKKIPKWRPPPLFSCNAMVQSGRVDLLMHPLTQKFLEMKWHAYGMYIHLLNLFIYLLFLGMVTLYAGGVLGGRCSLNVTFINSFLIEKMYKNISGQDNNTSHDTSGFLPFLPFQTSYDPSTILLATGILFSSCLGIIKEILQICQQKMRYLGESINVVEWILYITSICMVLPALGVTGNANQQYNSAAIAVFTAWFTVLLYFQRFDYIGIYIVMFLEILNTLLKVLAVFSVLIVAFGLAFYILLSQGRHLAFTSIPLAMIRTFSMMLGEIDFMNSFVFPYFRESPRSDVILEYPKTTLAVLIVFMILMPILLMNLLIGLAVGDIESVKKNAQLKRIAMQVDLHTSLERKLPTCLIKKVNKQEIVVYPNETTNRGNFFHRICVALNFFTPFHETHRKGKEFECLERSTEDFFYEQLERQQLSYMNLQNEMTQQMKILRLIMQKMEIKSEADETDEGVSLSELVQPLRQHRRNWSPASATSRKFQGLSRVE